MTVLDEWKKKENLRTRFPTYRKPCTSNYDYEGDSDLEEDDEEGDSDDEPTVINQPATEKSGNDSPELVKIENSDAKSSDSSDIISVSDLDSLFFESHVAKDGGGPGSHVGKVVVIDDVAFVT